MNYVGSRIYFHLILLYVHFVGQCSIEMDAKVHWCCCVDQHGLIPDHVQFALSIPGPRMEDTYMCLRWIGTQLINVVRVSRCSVLM